MSGGIACPMPPGFYNMDCMEAMKQFPDNFFDLALVDPPYGINADKFDCGSGAKKDKSPDRTARRVRKERLNHGTGKLKGRALNTMNCSWDNSVPPPPNISASFSGSAGTR